MTCFFRFFSAIIYAYGITENKFNIMLIGIDVFWICNLIYSFKKFKFRYIFLVFNIVIFVFFLSRPTIDMLNNINNFKNFNRNQNLFALNSVYVSIIFILIGQVMSEKILNKNLFCTKKENSNYNLYVHNLEFLSILMFYISVFFLFLVELEKFMYMRGRNYEEIYVSFSTKLPFFVNIFASMCKYFLCIFLACLPKKSKSFLPLCLYVLSSVPYFLIGARHKLVESVLFCLVYYIIRNVFGYDKKTRWIGGFEKGILCIGSPLGMALLGAHNYIRENKQLEIKNILKLIVDFFYKQGVSFDVLRMGYDTISKIRYTGFVNYSFGEILDYLLHGNIAQILLDAKSLGTGQNEVSGLYSNLMANRLSYTVDKNYFLSGHGWGSSYILDTYADWGYTGIIIFSLILGFLLSAMIKYMSHKNTFIRTVILVILTSIFYCPRTSSFRWISFLVYAQYYIPVIICFVGAKLLCKSYNIKLKNNINFTERYKFYDTEY